METNHVPSHGQTFKGVSVGLAIRLCDAILPPMVEKAPCRNQERVTCEPGAASGLDGMGLQPQDTPPASMASP